jgi:two-component sensor histidine kinase
MVMDTGMPESKEINMHGLLLSLRILPVVPQPKGGCAIVILQDVTELRKKDEELLIKSVVIKEIHHRVKNNLQTITSLLRLQERRAQSEETKLVLHDCIGRVNSIAIVHEYLSQQDSGLIDVGKVAKGIYQAILSSMLRPDFVLQADFRTDEVELPSEKATSIALILNELLQNTIEHAFEQREQGSLSVRFTEEQQAYVLSIADDGIGLPEGFQITGHKSLGLKIIKTMAEADLQGSFTLRNRPEGGTLAVVKIPKERER